MSDTVFLFHLKSAAPILVEVVQLDKIQERNEFVFTYSADNGAVVTFYTHPTMPWSCVLIGEQTNELGRMYAKAVIQAFCTTSLDTLKAGEGDKLNERLAALRV